MRPGNGTWPDIEVFSMTIRVLVVEDSGFFRRRIIAMIESDDRLEVVGEASNGLEAVAQAERLEPDVITMDIEMPLMDGITAVRKIMESSPTSILMLSMLTTEGARATLDALEAGAVDFIPKKFAEVTSNPEALSHQICSRIVALGKRRGIFPKAPPVAARPVSDAPAPVKTPVMTPVRSGDNRFRLVVIAASTGGPAALPLVLGKLPGTFPAPLLIVQHMPANFTPTFAQRLDQQCAITVKHAEDGDLLQPGNALVAPGGKQMTVERHGNRQVVRVQDGDPALNYKPSADILFSSVARLYSGQVLSVILTGMGADGREGARLLKQRGATVWAQDRESSVIYGMPGAVAKAGLTDEILGISSIGPSLARVVH